MLYDSSKAAVDAVVELAGQQPALFAEVFHAACNEPYPLAMRAARVVQFYILKNPHAIAPFLPDLVHTLLHNTVDGVKRSFLKILIEVVDVDAIPDAGLVYNRCLDWIFSEKESIAVRAYSMDLLYKFSLFEKELSMEFMLVLENVPLDESPGLECRRKQFLMKLKKNE
ncbi:MAG: hypothetical protein BWY70_01142 [Bacteroidetes bacterium ADurb.Bin408]|nr:MAG: hypothetical protein BWY70_01142 [Bacteroidetes bacterium ADurb.Bin408]